jgi:hypothetical protein
MLVNDTASREEISDGSRDPANGSRDDFTAEAVAALEELHAHGKDHIALLLRFGKAVSAAKAHLKHGEFDQWCGDKLKKSPSWVSSHRRLYESEENLKPALSWASEKGHRWAKCHSVERLLKLIAEWKKAMSGDAAPPKARQKPSEVIAKLQQRLNDADRDFIALRDPLTPEVKAQAAGLATLSSDDDAATKEKLAELARSVHWRPADFLAEICSALHVSPNVPAIGIIATHFQLPV